MQELKIRILFIFGLAILLTTTACVGNQGIYDWGRYENSLYSYYKHPGETEEYIQALEEVILNAEENYRVPPGLYAEYGYMQYQLGNFSSAVQFFEKERSLWPESAVFMDKMIINVNRMNR